MRKAGRAWGCWRSTGSAASGRSAHWAVLRNHEDRHLLFTSARFYSITLRPTTSTPFRRRDRRFGTAAQDTSEKKQTSATGMESHRPEQARGYQMRRDLAEWASQFSKLPEREQTLPILQDMLANAAKIQAHPVVKYKALIAECFHMNRSDLATLLYEELLRDHATQVPRSLYTLMLQGYGKAHDQAKIGEVRRQMRDAGVEPDMATFVVLLDVWGKMGDLRRMWETWHEMRNPPYNLQPNVMAYTSVIAALGKKGDTKEMEKIFEEMKHEGLEPNQATLNALLHGYGRQNMLNKMEAVLEKYFMQRDSQRSDASRFKMDNITFNSVIAAFAQVGQMEKAELYFDMIKQMGLRPNAITWNSYIHALGQAGLTDKMLRQLDEMRQQGVKPDVTTYNAVINAFGKTRDHASMMDSFVVMRREGIRPDITTYNTLINAWAKVGKATEAEKFYVLLKREGLQPDYHTIAGLMEAYTRAHQFDKVIRLFLKMKKEGRAPDKIIFNHLIDTYGRMGKPADAEQVFLRALKEYGVSPNANLCTSLIEAWARNGDLNRAEEWLHKMSAEYATFPNIKTYTTLLSFCIERNDAARGRRIIKMIEENKVPKDLFALRTIRRFHREIARNKRHTQSEADQPKSA